MPTIQKTLTDIQLRLSVIHGQHLKQGDLALLAGSTVRSMGEWLRGRCAPASMVNLLQLLAQLPAEDLQSVLEPWRTANEHRLSPEPTQKRSKKSS